MHQVFQDPEPRNPGLPWLEANPIRSPDPQHRRRPMGAGCRKQPPLTWTRPPSPPQTPIPDQIRLQHQPIHPQIHQRQTGLLF